MFINPWKLPAPLWKFILNFVLTVPELGAAQAIVLFYYFLKDTEEDLTNERTLNI